MLGSIQADLVLEKDFTLGSAGRQAGRQQEEIGTVDLACLSI